MQDLVFPRGYVTQAYRGGGWVHNFANLIRNVRQLAKNLWAPISEKFLLVLERLKVSGFSAFFYSLFYPKVRFSFFYEVSTRVIKFS